MADSRELRAAFHLSFRNSLKIRRNFQVFLLNYCCFHVRSVKLFFRLPATGLEVCSADPALCSVVRVAADRQFSKCTYFLIFKLYLLPHFQHVPTS